MVTIHEKTAQTFNTLGLGALLPALCIVKEELNGAYELELEHPYDEYGKWQRIERSRILYASTPKGMQPFRIYNVRPSMESITVNARHLFYDLLDNHCDTVYYNGTAAAALNRLKNSFAYSMPFTFDTDVTETGKLQMEQTNPVEMLLSEDENQSSFTKGFACEILRDHFNVSLLQSIGANRDVTIRYGKNLIGLEVTEDESEVKTRIVCNGKNGTVTVNSEHISDYVYPKIYILEDTGRTTAELRYEAQTLFDGGADLPKVNIKVEFLPLSKTEEYKEYAALEEVFLGDTVTVVNERMNFRKQAKVISYEWNCLLERYDKVELGDFMPTLASSVTLGVNSGKAAGTEADYVLSLISGGITIIDDTLYVCVDGTDYTTADRLFVFNAEGLQHLKRDAETGEEIWTTLIDPDGNFILPEEEMEETT